MMRRISCLYNILHYNNAWKYNHHGNQIEFAGAFLKGTVFDVRGCDNRGIIGPKARLSNCKITIIGDHCSLVIGGGILLSTELLFGCKMTIVISRLERILCVEKVHK